MKHTNQVISLFILLYALLSCFVSFGQRPQKLYPVSNGSRYGLVDSKRKLIVDYIYDYVSPFRYGIAVVKRNEHFGVVDFKGVEIVHPLYDEIKPLENGLSIVTLGDSSNLFDNTGMSVFNNWYYRIDPAGGGFFRITKKTHKGSEFIKSTIKHFHLENVIGLARDSVYFSEYLVSYSSKANKCLDGIWFSGGETLDNGRFKIAISKHTYSLDTLGNITQRDPDPCDFSIMNIFQPDEAPSYPGGDPALEKFMNENLKYPDESEVKYHNATVIVSVVIDQNGKVTNPHVIKSVRPDFDSVVIEALLKMDKWNPAKYNGTPVCWQLEFPVRFSIIGM